MLQPDPLWALAIDRVLPALAEEKGTAFLDRLVHANREYLTSRLLSTLAHTSPLLAQSDPIQLLFDSDVNACRFRTTTLSALPFRLVEAVRMLYAKAVRERERFEDGCYVLTIREEQDLEPWAAAYLERVQQELQCIGDVDVEEDEDELWSIDPADHAQENTVRFDAYTLLRDGRDETHVVEALTEDILDFFFGDGDDEAELPNSSSSSSSSSDTARPVWTRAPRVRIHAVAAEPQ